MRLILSILCLLFAAFAQAATLTWVDNSDNESIFRIERAASATGAFQEIMFVSSNVTSFTDLQGVPGNCYRVCAENDFGKSAYSNVACIPLPPTGQPPLAPSNLQLTAISPSQLRATWRDNASDEISQNLYCHPRGGPFKLYTAAIANVETLVISGLKRNTQYFCRMNACNGTLCSEYSNTDSERTLKW